MDQVIVGILRKSPEKLGLVSDWIERMLARPNYSDMNKDAIREWLNLIQQGGVEAVIEVLEDTGDEATRMRQSSPFAVLMPQDKRLEILKKYESFRARTPFAGV